MFAVESELLHIAAKVIDKGERAVATGSVAPSGPPDAVQVDVPDCATYPFVTVAQYHHAVATDPLKFTVAVPEAGLVEPVHAVQMEARV